MRTFLDWAANAWLISVCVTGIGLLLFLIYTKPIILLWFVLVGLTLWTLRRLDEIERRDKK